jgi:hypothetical protein
MDTQAIRTKTMSPQESMAHASENLLNVLFRDGSPAIAKRLEVSLLRLYFRDSLPAKSKAQLFILS